jgi:hypothetical protein
MKTSHYTTLLYDYTGRPILQGGYSTLNISQQYFTNHQHSYHHNKNFTNNNGNANINDIDITITATYGINDHQQSDNIVHNRSRNSELLLSSSTITASAATAIGVTVAGGNETLTSNQDKKPITDNTNNSSITEYSVIKSTSNRTIKSVTPTYVNNSEKRSTQEPKGSKRKLETGEFHYIYLER